ncbi:inositol monophosphatase 1-like [Antedon mediterranea]|uniref:inositol monophosphatase 1-like n=1 Tax=Antedon mediterranea TaxID=105859 RepID=UPI003AF5B2C2
MAFDGHDLNDYLQSAINVAKAGGELIIETFYKEKSIETKSSSADLVTETDKAVEKLIFSTLKNKYPQHSFIGEESVSDGEAVEYTDNATWMVDPVDGTCNFVHSFPTVAVSIGLTINKQAVVGVVYNPILNEMYTAIKGGGAFLNNKPIKVSGQTELCKSLIIHELGSGREADKMEINRQNIHRVVQEGKVHGTRSMGSAALNMSFVARGAAEAYFEYGLHCWDYCAATIIVQEAGGCVRDPGGGEVDLMARRVIGGSSVKIVEDISKLLTPIEFERD